MKRDSHDVSGYLNNLNNLIKLNKQDKHSSN
jgi:hypothetical protein